MPPGVASDAAKYESVCKCGKVHIKLEGEPIFTDICYCNDCCTVAHYIDEKAKTAECENLSFFKEGEMGAYGVLFWASAFRFIKGEENLVSVKLYKGKLVRAYSSCCCTCMIIGGKEFPYNGRGVNGNTLRIAASGEVFRPMADARVMGRFARKDHWDAIPNDGIPKSNIVPFCLLITRLLPWILFPCCFPGPGRNKGSQIAGMYNSIKEVTEEIPLASYHAAGHKLDTKDNASKDK